MIRPRDRKKLPALINLTSLVKEASLAELASNARDEANLRAALEELQVSQSETSWIGSDGTRADLHRDWIERRRIELNGQLATTLAKKDALRQKAERALARDQVLKKLLDR